MEHSFRVEIGTVRRFGRVEGANARNAPLDSDLRYIASTINIDAEKTRLVSRLGSTPILLIDLVIHVPQVLDLVVQGVPVDVVDFVLRFFSGDHQPDDAVHKILGAVNAYLQAAMV
jgi:hypothetical protein